MVFGADSTLPGVHARPRSAPIGARWNRGRRPASGDGGDPARLRVAGEGWRGCAPGRRNLDDVTPHPAGRPAACLACPACAAEALAALEARHGGRLGVAVLDTGSGRRLVHRGGERFPLTSTFKFLAAGCVLARVDRGEEQLGREVAYAKEDLVTYSPVTGQHASMTIGALCDAAVTLSDNTAGNLLLDSFGGPAGLTEWLRGLGDAVTRLDRRRPR